MKKLLLLAAFFSCLRMTAQEKPATAFHFELGGSGGFYSLSWERSIFHRNDWLLQAGLSFIPTGTHQVFTAPVLLKKTFGQHAHRLETGIGQGISLAFGDGVKCFPRGILLLGWRYQKDDSPWIVRAFYSPLVSYLVDFQYQHWGGIGIGYQINAG